MSFATTLTDRAAAFVDRRTDRRGFLSRSAMVGSALSVAGSTYVLRPTSAYAAVCTCRSRSCDCSALCCDGYTEFCCAIYGENSCPPDTILAGWWKVDNSSYCDGAARYYMDCNKTSPRCSCGSSGVCSGSDTVCQCRSCNNRKDGCTVFRYGNCNNDVTCVGPIMCRVVTCTKPWEIDPGCSTVSRTDNNTRFHHRPCLEPPPREPTHAEIAFVKALYRDFLFRAHDDKGLDYWTSQLVDDVPRDVVGSSFSFSPEYVTVVVRDLYNTLLDRNPDEDGGAFWRDQLRNNVPPADLIVEFASGNEFYAKAGGTNDGFITRLYDRVLDRAPGVDERLEATTRLMMGAERRELAEELVASEESRGLRVDALYQRFLGRGAEPKGRDYWIGVLENGRDVALALYLASSPEYTSRAQRRFPADPPDEAT